MTFTEWCKNIFELIGDINYHSKVTRETEKKVKKKQKELKKKNGEK